jgi:hypothetical protein
MPKPIVFALALAIGGCTVTGPLDGIERYQEPWTRHYGRVSDVQCTWPDCIGR